MVGSSFPAMQVYLGELVFVPFTVVSAMILVFLTVYLPETKGHSVNDVAGIFERTEHPWRCATGFIQRETGSKDPHQAETQAELAPLNEAPDPVPT